MAMFSAMDSTKAVLPMAGRAAMIMRSEFCQPEVILFSSREARVETAETRLPSACVLYLLNGPVEYGVYLRYVFLEIALGYVEEAAFGFLQEVVDVVALVESAVLHL